MKLSKKQWEFIGRKAGWLKTSRASYIGNCTNIFDKNTGDCLLDVFVDVSDFASKEEEVRNDIDVGRNILLNLACRARSPLPLGRG